MSATPIPRTLTLILYGDLDVSVLDELPPGRQKTDTFLVNETYRGRLNGFLRQQVQAGHQCYVVCPSVEEGETESGKSGPGLGRDPTAAGVPGSAGGSSPRAYEGGGERGGDGGICPGKDTNSGGDYGH